MLRQKEPNGNSQGADETRLGHSCLNALAPFRFSNRDLPVVWSSGICAPNERLSGGVQTAMDICLSSGPPHLPLTGRNDHRESLAVLRLGMPDTAYIPPLARYMVSILTHPAYRLR